MPLEHKQTRKTLCLTEQQLYKKAQPHFVIPGRGQASFFPRTPIDNCGMDNNTGWLKIKKTKEQPAQATTYAAIMHSTNTAFGPLISKPPFP